MAEFIFIIIAVSCFAAQFAFTKLYEEKAGQSIDSTLIMIIGTSLSGAVIFFALNGFTLSFSSISTMWAVIFAIVMIPYYLIGVKILSLGSLAIYKKL